MSDTETPAMKAAQDMNGQEARVEVTRLRDIEATLTARVDRLNGQLTGKQAELSRKDELVEEWFEKYRDCDEAREFAEQYGLDLSRTATATLTLTVTITDEDWTGTEDGWESTVRGLVWTVEHDNDGTEADVVLDDKDIDSYELED